MDDVQRAIEALQNMKLFYNPFNKNGEIDTAISAMQELQQYKKGAEQIKHALKKVDISELNIECGVLSDAMELMQQTKPVPALPEKKMTLDEAITHAREVASKKYTEGMLCHANPDDGKLDGCIECAKEHEQLAEWLEELRQYRELEKHGRLIKLPCTVGDVVYTNLSVTGWCLRKKNRPYAVKIVFIGINGKDNIMNVAYENGNMTQFPFSQIGKTVFLTKEAAEKELEGMKNG